MKRRFYFATFIAAILTTSLTAQAGVFFQNYTNATLTVIFKYCQFGKTHAQEKCGSAYTSGPIAPNSVYQVPTVAADYVSAYMASTTDGWSYTSNNPSQGSCTIMPLTSDILFANFSKSLLPQTLQCQQTVGKINK